MALKRMTRLLLRSLDDLGNAELIQYIQIAPLLNGESLAACGHRRTAGDDVGLMRSRCSDS